MVEFGVLWVKHWVWGFCGIVRGFSVGIGMKSTSKAVLGPPTSLIRLSVRISSLAGLNFDTMRARKRCEVSGVAHDAMVWTVVQMDINLMYGAV